MAKNKEGFLDGTCKCPAKTDHKFHQWIRCDLLVMKWILNSVDAKIKDTLLFIQSSKELWTELVERYGQTNNVEIYQIKKDLSTITQENSSLIEYYSLLKRIWENLDSLDPVPLCTCGVLDQCTCHLLKRMLDRESNAKLIQFLMGLNSGYEVVKTNVLSMDHLPPMNKALSLLHKIERQMQIADAVDVLTEANAYVSVQQSDHRSSSFKKPKGHTRNTCFKLNKVSGPGKLRGSGSTNNYSVSAKHAAHAADVVTAADSVFDAVHASPLDSAVDALDQSVVADIIKSVTHNVLKAFTEHSTSSDSYLHAANFAGTTQSFSVFSASNTDNIWQWIVDTGASDHMTSHLDMLHDVKVLPKPLIVGLPDGSFKMVHKIGKAVLSSSIILHRVLLVPDFKQNLLSVGRLIDDNNLPAVFDTTKCIFQDLSSKVVVGTTRRHGDLYWFC
ncbi:hypothetical protein RND81_11G187800 [Saponaria officinalis]|uniref:Retrovirus-related Pol polyprotein from transposon TNT 1-94-like beta-barrel domain-containing protein n=1 Tax=Saponaria officinalis TaxID=3572 RepID=A0AAW1HP68_SAPOF